MEKQINLNSVIFNKIITKEDILKHVSQESIFSFYMEEDIFETGVFNSPLREDKTPSFSLYFHKHHHDTLMWCDLATGESGDFIVLVQKMFKLSYYDSLMKIAYDFGLSTFDVGTVKKLQSYTKIISKKTIELGVKLRKWKIKDKKYWSQFGITKETLKRFNVYPISHIFFNDNCIKAAEYAYVYVEFKDGIKSYKIYQPYEIKSKKWLNNADYSTHQGYEQLPKTGDILIITKSLKDVMSIHDVLDIPAIGLQSETVMMKMSVMEEYKSRFKRVFCLFDNDEAGQQLANKFHETFNIPHFFMPDFLGVKDFSDLVKEVGLEEAEEIFYEQSNI